MNLFQEDGVNFFFDFIDGSYKAKDLDGTDLSSPEAAREEALKALIEVYRHEPRNVDYRQVACAIRDDRGMIVYRATLTLEGTRLSNV